MLPAGPLMIEHRLIEKMIALWAKELSFIAKTGQANVSFIEKGIDFMRTYADRCHHGKEEDILFSCLKEKNLAKDLKGILDELINEHAVARKTVAALAKAKDKYGCGDKKSLGDIVQPIKLMTELYPSHIEKEDKHFFLPCMDYLNKQEQSKMLEEFREFDRLLIHEKYKSTVETLQADYR